MNSIEILEELNKLDKIEEGTNDVVLEQAIKQFKDKLHLAQQFIKILPTYYDSSNIWWMWNFEKSCYVEIDEIDLLNKISFSSEADIISSKERTEIINSLKQIARVNAPKPIKKDWLQFNNEVIELETGFRFPATPEYFYVNPLPYKLGSCEDTPTIDRIFEEWVGKKYVKTLYEIIAYCLLRDYPIERIFCFIGAGSNGKSCFLKLIRNFVGDFNITSTDLKIITKSRFETAKLRNKLVVMLGETDFDNLDNTQLIKKLVSGKDPIAIEYKNKGFIDYINYAKLLIATNSLPATNDKSIGWYRRWSIIDFPNQFNEKKDILLEIPEIEYRNLGLKCITLILEIMKNREFTNEGTIEDKRRRYEEKSDPIQNFIKEFTIEGFDGSIWKGDFEKKLNQWCHENKHRQMSEVAIGKKMKEKGIEQRLLPADWLDGKNSRAWIGIKWK